MTVCILCFALGGYILIQSSFSTQLKRECEAAYNNYTTLFFGRLTE